MADTSFDYDVVIVGGGPAGLSAGVFTARADFRTLVVEHNRSLLRKSAHLENYLGFPAGVRPTTFLEIAQDHATNAGCVYVSGEVVDIKHAHSEDHSGDAPETGAVDSGFIVSTADQQFETRYVIVASWSDCSFLDTLGVERGTEDGGHVPIIEVDADGRTSVDGVYAAGRITDQHHQAIVNAGHGAHVAIALIEEVNPAFWNDWVAIEGYYDSYDKEVPVGVEEISHEERERRIRDSRATMRRYFGEHSVNEPEDAMR
ncbi:oxidoreductase (homolog to thioredoxin-disulfide reductase) [Natronomonas pharaonis DSM 2160]|uniref:Oxidoreductase (Homolog to thioredoxin-disulfide reductase) n=2 Tax=Natronomonas pharaonis TaxID=2257 RepID=A0A1U7EXG6_NATPD|nr:oxidoreductase (homolog to thioredoxin-disulfide reductase) [Natronomonas pharaonis DSM 2160]